MEFKEYSKEVQSFVDLICKTELSFEANSSSRDLIDGNLAKLKTTDDSEELDKRLYYAILNLVDIYRINKDRFL